MRSVHPPPFTDTRPQLTGKGGHRPSADRIVSRQYDDGAEVDNRSGSGGCVCGGGRGDRGVDVVDPVGLVARRGGDHARRTTRHRRGDLVDTGGPALMADRQGLVSFARLWPLLIVAAGVNALLFGSDCEPVAGNSGASDGQRGRRRSRASGGIWLIFVGGLLLAESESLVVVP